MFDNFVVPEWLKTAWRVLSFTSAIVGVITYAVYTARVITGSSSAEGYVFGIFAAAIVWTTGAGVTAYFKRWQKGATDGKGKSMKSIVMLVVLLDLIFIGLFIGVAALLGPSGSGRGSGSAVKRRDNDTDNDNDHDGLVGAALGMSIVGIFSHAGSSISNAMQMGQRPPNPKTIAQNPMNVVRGDA